MTKHQQHAVASELRSDRGSESAFYGRYSDGEKQRASSMEDQVRECREEARRDGNYIPDANIFADPDVRGATESRPQLDRLCGIVRSGKATFKDIYIADTSRLARNSALAPRLRKFFKHYGICLHFVENGMKSGTSGFDLQHTILSLMDEQYSEQLGEKISRAQIGLVLKGNLPSGKCYGYRNIPEEDPTKIGKWGRPVVNCVKQRPLKKEADVVLEIFERYAKGEGGYCYIAGLLRERGVDPPRKGAKNEGRGWSETAVMHILNNERYIGIVKFGKTYQRRNPDTQRLEQRRREESEWTVYHDEELRIVSDSLWEAVKARQAFIRGGVGGPKAGGMARTPASCTYLYSGLLHCGVCGNSMVLTHDSYKCSIARRGWDCSNKRYVKRESLERQLTEVIASTIRSEANFAYIKSLFKLELATELKQQQARDDDARSQLGGLAEEQKQLQAALKNLAEEVATYGGDDAIREARRAKGARLAVVTNMLKRAETSASVVSEADIDAFLQGALDKLADILLDDPRVSKQELLKRISSLTLTPVEHAGGPAFELSGDLTFLSGKEVMMLLPSGPTKQEHNPFVFSLDGLILNLGLRGEVVSVVYPRETDVEEAKINFWRDGALRAA